MSRYSDKLKDPRWQKRRLEILDRDNWSCVNCGWEKEELNVHHKWYDDGVEPWDHVDECLVTLCKKCHKMEHENKDHYEKILLLSLYSSGLLVSDLLDLALSLSSIHGDELKKVVTLHERKQGAHIE